MEINPLKSVDGVELPLLSENGYGYSRNDMSADGAGRTEDLLMDTKLLGTSVKLNLRWENLSIADGAKVFKAFEQKYVMVEFLDGLEGKHITKEFYAGKERVAGNFNGKTGKWGSITVNIVERGADRATYR